MPRLYGKQDVGINLLGGIFQGMLDRRQRNQDLEDQEAQRQQQATMQQGRQEHGVNLLEMQRQWQMENREYKTEQGATPEEWKQYMQEKGIPYTGKWSTDKWSIDRYDDQQQEQTRAAAKVKAGSRKVEGAYTGKKLIDQIKAIFPDMGTELRRKTQEAYRQTVKSGVVPDVYDVGKALLTGGMSALFDVPTVGVSGEELIEREQQLKSMMDVKQLTKNMDEGSKSGIANYIATNPDYWFNGKLLSSIEDTFSDATRNIVLENATMSALQFVPEAQGDPMATVIDPARMEEAYRVEMGENVEPLQLGDRQDSVYGVISAMEDAGVPQQTMVGIFERYQNPNLGDLPDFGQFQERATRTFGIK